MAALGRPARRPDLLALLQALHRTHLTARPPGRQVAPSRAASCWHRRSGEPRLPSAVEPMGTAPTLLGCRGNALSRLQWESAEISGRCGHVMRAEGRCGLTIFSVESNVSG